jgi:hypothetical protein
MAPSRLLLQGYNERFAITVMAEWLVGGGGASSLKDLYLSKATKATSMLMTLYIYRLYEKGAVKYVIIKLRNFSEVPDKRERLLVKAMLQADDLRGVLCVRGVVCVNIPLNICKHVPLNLRTVVKKELESV